MNDRQFKEKTIQTSKNHTSNFSFNNKEIAFIMEALHRDSSPTGLLSVYHMTLGHTTKIYWQLTNANDQ